ncbi:MAG: hypothetical protein ACYTEL_14955 [Planctomycetota bacterium]|jgi:CO/xanthine dehydrogenase FAD-binding subunit
MNRRASVLVVLLMVSAAPATIGGTITIHQIPEPMTAAILALGGLVLLRSHRG